MFGVLRPRGALNNYEYCAEWVRETAGASPAVVLDYGCGAGEIIRELIKRDLDAFGCDVFYDGGDYSPSVPADWLGTRVLRIEDARIPFPSSHFDFIVGNQVMEHVEDLEAVLREMHRVLKPGGMILSIFADRGVWREGHCGIPFVHRFRKGSAVRVYYAALLRAAGFGYFTEGKTIMGWSRDFCDWLDRWTFYRREFETYFSPLQHVEEHWLSKRLGAASLLVEWWPAPFRRFLVSRLCGLVFVCRKDVAQP